jgi:hypothetical protein
MLSQERQARCEALLRAGLADVQASLLSLAATQPDLALEAYCALAEAVYPYLKGDRRAGGVLAQARAAESLLREPAP